jgi:hypothetical protein
MNNRILLNDVLFVLYAGERLSWPDLNRTNFQKILYLSCALAPLAGIEWEYSFTNAPYGPFNRDIHQATDQLVYHGYAVTTNLIVQRDSKMRVSYRITKEGSVEVDLISQLGKEKKRLEWITMVMKVLDIYGPTIITKLAYREPTFSTMRKENKGGAIDLSPEENQSVTLLASLKQELKAQYSIELDTITATLIAYFDYLSKDIGTKSWD